LAELAFEVIHAVSRIQGQEGLWLWGIHHNAVWGELIEPFSADTNARQVFRRRLFRLVRKEIAEISQRPNFKNTPILGYVLNIVGIRFQPKREGYGSAGYRFAWWVRAWTRCNFRRLYEKTPNIMKAALIDRLSYEEKSGLLYMTRPVFLRDKPRVQFVQL
jgi:hypothetical protein